ncbi:MAG: hypothetical protein FD145_1192 [Candidatus Saganbacteria bacterium]|uniref:Uncharacterized protein n=1 Tax=Candidatus Saganbacteria bacterium TaxID=2575572 RepID=A0A833L323_UNCSA|nr:MAG: hypothetical protein FD145_1192 [Candidatus Saganbacteria bacterium]
MAIQPINKKFAPNTLGVSSNPNILRVNELKAFCAERALPGTQVTITADLENGQNIDLTIEILTTIKGMFNALESGKGREGLSAKELGAYEFNGINYYLATCVQFAFDEGKGKLVFGFGKEIQAELSRQDSGLIGFREYKRKLSDAKLTEAERREQRVGELIYNIKQTEATIKQIKAGIQEMVSATEDMQEIVAALGILVEKLNPNLATHEEINRYNNHFVYKLRFNEQEKEELFLFFIKLCEEVVERRVISEFDLNILARNAEIYHRGLTDSERALLNL